jgi:hypothetical protein
LTAGLAQEARTLYEGTGYAIEASSGFASFWELATYLRGYEQLLMDLVGNPDFVTALMTRLLEINIAGTGRFLAETGPYIQVFRAADDLATQRGLLMSPRIFRKLLKPFYQKYFDFVKTHTGAKILFHSCGNITDLVDDLIETGVEILNPVQVSAMPDTAALKSRFAGRVAFWGGVDTQHIMPYGTPAEVEQEVIRRISDLGAGVGLFWLRFTVYSLMFHLRISWPWPTLPKSMAATRSSQRRLPPFESAGFRPAHLKPRSPRDILCVGRVPGILRRPFHAPQRARSLDGSPAPTDPSFVILFTFS